MNKSKFLFINANALLEKKTTSGQKLGSKVEVGSPKHPCFFTGNSQ